MKQAGTAWGNETAFAAIQQAAAELKQQQRPDVFAKSTNFGLARTTLCPATANTVSYNAAMVKG